MSGFEDFPSISLDIVQPYIKILLHFAFSQKSSDVSNPTAPTEFLDLAASASAAQLDREEKSLHTRGRRKIGGENDDDMDDDEASKADSGEKDSGGDEEAEEEKKEGADENRVRMVCWVVSSSSVDRGK